MGLLNIIRRMHLRQKLSIREISRLTGVSRNTVTKHLAANTIEPKFATPERQSKIDPFADKLAGWLKTEAGRARKERRTIKQLHAELVVLGFTGSYARVAAFARTWKAERQREQQTTGRGTFVPLHFAPGDAFQFDWSEDFAVLGGERTKLQMAHIKLSHSRAFLLRAYPLQTHEMLFDAHWHAFRVFGGVPARGIYDNMRTAVDRVGRGKERQINMRFLAMTNHYVYEPEFCNPAAGWEKGQVEKNVRDSRHQMLQGMPDFPDLAALNAWLEDRCQELWRQTPHGKQPGTIADVWAEEQLTLMPLPVAFDGFVELSKRVSPTCLISFERNRYSVPASFANRPVSLRTFYQNLSPSIYATQFNGNTRFDTMTAVYAAYVRDRGLLTWPQDDAGRQSFKLDRLAPANGFNGHNAHDALGDVEATIHIARRIADRNPSLWAELLSNAYKAEVQVKLETFKPMELVLRIGGGEPRAYTGVFCGYAQGHNTRAAFFDLDAADPSGLLTASDDALFAAVDASPKQGRRPLLNFVMPSE